MSSSGTVRVIAASLLALLATGGARLAGQLQFAELGKSHLPRGFDSVTGFVAGDVDRDGDPDLFVVNDGQPPRLYLNDGSGVFTDGTQGRIPPGPTRLTAAVMGDVDGDGDLDLIVLGPAGNSRLYLNDGRGTFADGTAGRFPQTSGHLASGVLADLDGDSDLDLAIAGGRVTWPPSANRIFRNDGRGVFTDATAGRMPPTPYGSAFVMAVDVDRDGDLDLLFEAQVLVNDGGGAFTDETAGRLPPNAGWFHAAGDVDGDGDPDLIGSGDGRDLLFLNNGLGWFSDGTAGRLPLASGNSSGLALVDVDGDGDLDLVFAAADTLRSYANDGRGAFSAAPGGRLLASCTGCGVPVLVLDADGDGRPDLVFWRYGRPLKLFLHDGTDGFVDATADGTIPLRVYARVAASADVDGDGAPELLLTGDTNPGVTLFQNDGRGRLTATSGRLPPLPGDAWALAFGDLDGDGDQDLVVGNSASSSRLLLNDGRGFFTDATAGRLATGTLTSAVIVSDVDGDGDLDLVFGNRSVQSTLFLNDGRASFTDVTATRLPQRADPVAVLVSGDVDADGDEDLFIGTFQQQCRLYLNDGRGTFTDATAVRLPVVTDSPSAAALADVDGDGDPDLVIAERSQRPRLFVNDGRGFFTDASAARLPPAVVPAFSMSVGDVDGDGFPDLVFAVVVGNLLYLNDGTGRFVDATAARLPVSTEQTHVAHLLDADRDGDLDVLFAGAYMPITLYTNLLRQTHAPLLARAGRSYALELYGRRGFAAPGQVALPLLAPRRLAAPIEIRPFGFLALDPLALLVLAPEVIPAPAGLATLRIQMPADPALRGLTLHAQSLILHDASPAGWRLTNLVSDTFQR